MKNSIKAVIFDIGNTLIDATGIAKKALIYTANKLNKLNIIDDINEFCKTYSEIDKQIEGIDINHLYSGIQILTPVAESLKLKQPHQFFYNFIVTYRDHVKVSISHNVSARKVFTDLQNMGIKIGILTDGTTYEQIEQLYLLGVLEYTDEIVTSQEVKSEKPHPKTFFSILEKLNCEAEDAIMVGDDLIRDISGAKKVGMTTVLLSKYLNKDVLLKTTIKSDYIINELDELFKVLSAHGR